MQQLWDFLRDYRVVAGVLGIVASAAFEGWRWWDALPSETKRKGFIIASLAISLVATVVRAQYGDIGNVWDAVGGLILSWLIPLATGTLNHTRYMKPTTTITRKT